MASHCYEGGMVGGFCATNVGHFRPLGIEGWRLAFHFVALISFVCCLLVLRYAADPRRKVHRIDSWQDPLLQEDRLWNCNSRILECAEHLQQESPKEQGVVY